MQSQENASERTWLTKGCHEKQGLHPGSVFLTAFNKQEEKITHILFFLLPNVRFLSAFEERVLVHFRLSEAGERIWKEARSPEDERRVPSVWSFLRGTTRTWTPAGTALPSESCQDTAGHRGHRLCIKLKTRAVRGRGDWEMTTKCNTVPGLDPGTESCLSLCASSALIRWMVGGKLLCLPRPPSSHL